MPIRIINYKDRIQAVADMQTNKYKQKPDQSIAPGVGFAWSYDDRNYKAIIPQFLYKPPWGYPLNKDIPEIRRLSKSPFISLVETTITDETARLDWIIDPEENMVPESVLKDTEDFFYNPNRNEESMECLFRKVIPDMIEIDAGVFVKVRDWGDDFQELYAYDGGTFTKNPDVHGILPETWSYFQYGWNTGARPIAFNKNEVVYMMRYPRTDNIYGLGRVEILKNVIQLLIYGVDSNLEYFTSNSVPKGILKMINANKSDIHAFRSSWEQAMKVQDEAGNWRRQFHKMPIMNQDGEFIRVGFSNVELELLEQQKWFSKLVLACFGVTPSEAGFTEDSNRATDVVQSNVFKRKAIAPLVNLLEYHINTQVVNDLPWIKGHYENKVFFRFDKSDLVEELNKRQIVWGDYKTGLITKNEGREKIDMDAHDDGDEFKKEGNNFAFGNMPGQESNAKKDGSNLNDKEDKKKFPDYDDEQKSMNTSSSVVLKEFEKQSNPKVLKKKISDEINEIKKKAKLLLKQEGILELKAADEHLVNKILALLSFDFLKDFVSMGIRYNFIKGLDAAEKQALMNFVPNQKAIKFLEDYTFENIKNLESDLKDNLRQELKRGLMNNEGLTDLSERVSTALDVGKDRAEAIARTEYNRAQNMGELDGWKQSGRKVMKEWDATLDKKPDGTWRTSEICRGLNGQRVLINEKFNYRGESFEAPPAHPNCRSGLNYYPMD